jgi:hypothetical protein
VRAALDLVAAVADLGAEAGVPGLAARCGMVTGEVAVTLGARQKRLLGAAGSPHAGHTTAGAPHSTQNRSLAARPAPHPPHVTTRQL